MTKPILIVITRENRAERPTEAQLSAVFSGLATAAENNQLGTPENYTTDTFVKTTPRQAGVAGIAAEIARVSRTRYSAVQEKANEGLAVYEYSYNATGRTEEVVRTIPAYVDDLSGEEVAEQIIKEKFTVRGTKDIPEGEDTNETFEVFFDNLADCQAYIANLHPSDGYDLLGDHGQPRTEVLETRPCLWNIPDRLLFQAPVKNTIESRQNENDRH